MTTTSQIKDLKGEAWEPFTPTFSYQHKRSWLDKLLRRNKYVPAKGSFKREGKVVKFRLEISPRQKIKFSHKLPTKATLKGKIQ